MLILNGEVLEETINLQVIRLRERNRTKYIVQHFASEQSMPLLDALSGRQKWVSFVPGDDDQSAMNRCKRYVARALKKRMLETKEKISDGHFSRTLSDILTGYAVPAPVPAHPPTAQPTPPVWQEEGVMERRTRIAARLARSRQCDCSECVSAAIEQEDHAQR